MIQNPQIKDLPAWVQEHIQALENQVINLQRVVDVFTGNRESHIKWNDWLNNEWHNIPDSCRVKYTLAGNTVSVKMSQDKLHLEVSGDDFQPISVFPASSNLIKVN